MRPSMLDPVRGAILAWLETEPDLSAVAVLARLAAAHPERFRPGHLRTVQRFVGARRVAMARDALLGRPAAAPRPNDTANPGSIPT